MDRLASEPTFETSGMQTSQEMETDKRRCLNCETALVGRFCHACGQDHRRGRLVTADSSSKVMSDERRGCSCSGVGCGCLLGFIFGALVVAGGAWGWWSFYKQAIRDPLMHLEVPEGPLTKEQTKDQIDQLGKVFLASSGNVGLVIGILKDGEQHVFGYGSTSRDRQQVPDGETVFELASCGKTFTATALADMHLKGELNWDDPLFEFLPAEVDVPTYENRQITLMDLATHTSSLPTLTRTIEENIVAGMEDPWRANSFEKLYRDLSEIELTRPIAKEYDYSNLGMGLLGHALERRAKVSYEELVIGRICEPLVMTSTKMTLDDSMKDRLATPHARGEPTIVWEDRTLAGAGSFLSTANDMLKYVGAQFDEDNELYNTLQATRQKRRVAGSPWESIGLAWHITSENAVDIVWHTGGSGGSSSYVGFIEQSQVGVVVLANSSSSLMNIGSDVSSIGDTILYLLHLH